MICKKCGSVLDADSCFCANCGAKVEVEQAEAPVIREAPVFVAPAPVKEEKKATFTVGKIIALAVGTLLIIIGLCRVFGADTTLSSTSFGGDFYTYTYRGIVAISKQLASIQAALGWVVVAIGAAIDVRALLR